VYEQGDAIVKQAAVDTHQLCVALVKLLHHPRCSAPRSAAQRTLLLLSDADSRLKERIGDLKTQEMLKVKFIQHEMRETAKLESQRFAEPEPELEQAVANQEDVGYWNYQAYDGEWEFIPPGADAAAEAAKPNYIDIDNLLEQSALAQSRKEGLKKLDDLTQAYKAALVKLIMVRFQASSVSSRCF
jgi:hypothetical protein